MIAYGLTSRRLRGCCPGHDDFPEQCYKNRRSIAAHRRDTLRNRRRARRIAKLSLSSATQEEAYQHFP